MVERQWRHRAIFAAVGVIAIGLVLWAIFHKKPAKAGPPPAIPVTAAQVQSQDIPVYVSALGAAQAWQSDLIYAQVTGLLLKVAVEGKDVKQGEIIAEVDPSLYAAALTQAQGALARDEALLADAKLDLVRYQTLAAQNSIARQQVDTQAALVKQDEGTVLLDQGAVQTAKVNLDRCHITSPISGRTGVRILDAGNLVTPGTGGGAQAPSASLTGGTSSATTGTGAIIVVNQIRPIAVTFSVPQEQYQRLAQASQSFHKPLATEAMDQDSGSVLAMGELVVADNRVDPSTGTVVMKARFANDDERLLPGQFVNVRLTLQTLSGAVTIPTKAVNRGPDGSYAYVIGQDGKAVMQPIKVGLNQGGVSVITSGLKAGQTVVTDGQNALTAGSPTRISKTPVSSQQQAGS